MSDPKIDGFELKPGFKGMASDTGSDQTMFKGVHWGKAMMWIFLLSDTFVFSCFLISYMKGRASTPVDWPIPSEVFALHVGGVAHSNNDFCTYNKQWNDGSSCKIRLRKK
jgi:hypothetical protein